MQPQEPNGTSDRPRRRITRPLVLRVLIVALAVLILIGVPAYVGGLPGFFGRYDELAPKYDPWSKSTHVSASCKDCHVPPNALAQTAFRAKMVGQTYVSLVSRSGVPDLFPSPRNEACLECHDNLRSVSPKGDLKIPHKAHVSVLKMDCVQCHDFLVHEKSPEGKLTPPMGGCLECHDGDKAKNACSACHTDKALPETHRSPDWTIIHAQKKNDPACVDCHAWVKDWCADCHARRPRSHGDNWRQTHRDAVDERRSCEACHEAAFCERCHGEVPQLNFNPALKIVR